MLHGGSSGSNTTGNGLTAAQIQSINNEISACRTKMTQYSNIKENIDKAKSELSNAKKQYTNMKNYIVKNYKGVSGTMKKKIPNLIQEIDNNTQTKIGELDTISNEITTKIRELDSQITNLKNKLS